MGAIRVVLEPGDDYNRKATEQELRNVPVMSYDDMREMMRSKEYRESSLVRELVAASIAKSDPSGQQPARQSAQPDRRATCWKPRKPR